MSNFKAVLDVLFRVPGATLPESGLLSGRSLLILSLTLAVICLFFMVRYLVTLFKTARHESLSSGELGALQRKNSELLSALNEIQASSNRKNNYISSLFSAMDSGVILFETDKSIILFNESAQRLANIDTRCFFHPEDLQRNSIMDTVFKTFESVILEHKTFAIKTRNSELRDLEIGVSPVLSKYRDGALLGVLVILKDITEREKTERIRKEFISNVSHEFRTPLTLISGFIETLKMWENLPAQDRRRSLEILEIETGRLSKLISELLLLSEIEHRIDNSASVPIDVEKSIEQAVMSLRGLAESKHQTIETKIDVEFPSIYGNESWFYHAFRNILENAIKYTPENGTIAVDAWVNSAALKVAVRDNGVGIPEAEHEKVFERFYRIEKARSSKTGGSGIGLAIVKEIMSLFGGSVELRSAPGEGSTFTLVFPLVALGSDNVSKPSAPETMLGSPVQLSSTQTPAQTSGPDIAREK